ncbi:MAG: archaellin/type IV pilin N-terminal domain-containing protein [Candidatus Woesearchaeota archaeon]
MDKKGLSPIIATVLLIAFAVALAAMIINWSNDFQVTSCAGVTLRVESTSGSPGFCYNGDEVQFTVRNEGPTKVDKVALRTNVGVADSMMEVGDVVTRSIPFRKVADVRIELIPYILKESEFIQCADAAITREVLVPCK